VRKFRPAALNPRHDGFSPEMFHLPPGTSMKWREPQAVLAFLILSAATLACLLPFLGKAVHIDDPLFIWTAQHIQTHPLDFYGFNVQWGVTQTPIFEVMQNPPLAAYYMAVVGKLFGWSEIALHFGFLFPAVAAVLGTYFVARGFCSHPFAVALATLGTPGFLLSATTLMCDVSMVALWVWAIFFWMRGLQKNELRSLGLAALLITACGLTKYYGLCLVPLLLVYSAIATRRAGLWLVYLCAPLALLALYQYLTQKMYGRGLLMDAANYATTMRVGGELPVKLLTALAFTGGCVLIAFTAVPLAWGKRGVLFALAGIAVVALVLLSMKKLGDLEVSQAGHLFVLQMAVFIVGGGAVLVLATADIVRHKDALSVLLLLWIVGTFLFASVVNWTVAGRNILPMIPPVAIVLVRRMEKREWAFAHFWWALGISLAVGLIVARADLLLADSARTAAVGISTRLAAQSKDIAFEGHWGFQYYMEQLGNKPLDREHLNLVPNEMIVIPVNNSVLFQLPAERVEGYARENYPTSKWVAIMGTKLGAGYYSDGWGPAPFIFGQVPLEPYYVFRVTK
jgi:hypothetical protein